METVEQIRDRGETSVYKLRFDSAKKQKSHKKHKPRKDRGH